MAITSRLTIGIDVAKDTFDSATFPAGGHASHPYTDKEVRAFIKQLVALKPDLIVLESTGGYERRLIAALHDADLPVSVVNPRQARDFARGVGQLAKNDKVDAAILARFGAQVELRLKPADSQEQILLAELSARRRQLVAMRAAEDNRLQQACSKPICRSIHSVMRILDTQIDQLDADIATLIESNAEWKQTAAIVESAPGIGSTTSAMLVSSLPELGHLNRGQIAALVGLAPYARDSGKSSAPRSIWGGRAYVRCGLYMATLAARRFNPQIRAFSERLKKAGKPFKVIMTACMRKLLTLLNCMVKNNSYWRNSCPKSN